MDTQTPASISPVNQGLSIETYECPQCHIQVRTTDYFCFNCGKALREKPKPIDWLTQASVYVGSILLPPMGLIWGIRYLRQENQQAKVVGIIAILLTLITLAFITIFTINLVNTVNQQIEAQMSTFMGF